MTRILVCGGFAAAVPNRRQEVVMEHVEHVDLCLPAEALGITEREREALIRVSRDLDSGKIGREQYDQGSLCGTAICIGGWMAAYMGMEARQYVLGKHPGVTDCGGRDGIGGLLWGRSIASSVAAGLQACRNFLTTGRADWDRCGP